MRKYDWRHNADALHERLSSRRYCFGKDSPSPPPAPDYVGAAREQGAANKEAAQTTALLGNPNIFSPYGSQTVSYSEGPNGNLVPTINQSLNPQSQDIFNQQQNVRLGLAGLGQAALGTARDTLGRGFDMSSVPGIQSSVSQPNLQGSVDLQRNVSNPDVQRGLDLSGIARMPVNAGTTAQEAIMSRLQPQLERERTMLDTQLRNQGLAGGGGGEAYQNAMRQQNQRENDLLTQAALHGLNLDMSANQQGFGQALAQGGFANQAAGQQFGQNLGAANFANQAALAGGGFANQAAGQQFSQELQAGQFGNTAQQQALAQALYQRNLPLNEITALMSGSQIQNPQFQQYGGATVQPANYANIAAQQGAWNQGIFNAQQGAANAANQGLYGLGAAGLAAAGSSAGTWLPMLMTMSDRRLKSHIRRIGIHPLGIGWYEFDIFGERKQGVMADEVEGVMPQAVHVHPSGFKMVDYGRLNARH